MQYKEIEYHSEEEWHDLRKKGIGGSDAGVKINSKIFYNFGKKRLEERKIILKVLLHKEVMILKNILETLIELTTLIKKF